MTRFVEFLEFPWLDWNPVCFTLRNSLSFCVLNCVDQRERWLKPARAKSVWVCRRETAWESRDCRNAKRSPFVCVLVWVYFEHERFESGFRDLTLCVKVLRQPVARDLFQSLAAGIMLVEPQQSSDNSLCWHPAASNTSQAGIICHQLQKRQVLAPNSKPIFDPKIETIFGFA